MKKFALLILSAAILNACQSKNNNSSTTDSATLAENVLPEGEAPKVQVENPIYEFGKIKQGDKIQHEFTFKNVGKSPLIITDASATCGCTIPEYPTEPIKPGESGKIKVIFNSTGKMGLQDKIVTITSNANPAFEKLHLVGDVLEKK